MLTITLFMYVDIIVLITKTNFPSYFLLKLISSLFIINFYFAHATCGVLSIFRLCYKKKCLLYEKISVALWVCIPFSALSGQSFLFALAQWFEWKIIYQSSPGAITSFFLSVPFCFCFFCCLFNINQFMAGFTFGDPDQHTLKSERYFLKCYVLYSFIWNLKKKIVCLVLSSVQEYRWTDWLVGVLYCEFECFYSLSLINVRFFLLFVRLRMENIM